jgi:hypothetical protein
MGDFFTPMRIKTTIYGIIPIGTASRWSYALDSEQWSAEGAPIFMASNSGVTSNFLQVMVSYIYI